MADEKKHELFHDQLDEVTGGRELQIGEKILGQICPHCLVNLDKGRFTRPGWEQQDPSTGKVYQVYADGFICPKCGYEALFEELSYFVVTKDGLKPVE